MNKQKEAQRLELLEASGYAIGAGIIICSFAPIFPPAIKYGLVIGSAGLAGVIAFFRTKSDLDKVFETCGLYSGSAYPLLKSKQKTDISTVYAYTIPAGLSLKDFTSKKEAIENHLGYPVDIKYTFKALELEVFDCKPKVFEYTPLKTWGGLKFTIGYTSYGELITCDLSTGSPHLLVAGETGSGKSTALRAIITDLILANNVELKLIDLKYGAEFQLFKNSSKVTAFAEVKNQAFELLEEVLEDVEHRYKLFSSSGVKDIESYNKKRRNNKLKRQVIVIDEYAELAEDKKCIELIQRISAIARASGIHLIVSTQKPLSSVINSVVKANITTVLGLKTNNHTDSSVIIGHPGLETLRGYGDAIYKKDGNEFRIQVPYLKEEQAAELIKGTITKPKIKPLEPMSRPDPSEYHEEQEDLLC